MNFDNSRWWRSPGRGLLAVAVAAALTTPADVRAQVPIEDAPVLNLAQARQKAQVLRAKYPFVSLDARLAYELNPARPRLSWRIDSAAKERLEKFETSLQMVDSRTMALASLHSREVLDFVRRDGMGVGRMTSNLSPRSLMMPAITSISAAPSPLTGDIGEKVALPALKAKVRESSLPSVEGLGLLHVDGVYDFASPESMGLISRRRVAAGFQAHHFTRMPGSEELVSPTTNERWLITRLELVSLLKQGKPAVYVSDHLPRMAELQHARVRPLTPFEDDALKLLRKGEDTAVAANANQIRMVGAIRAAKQCLRCHTAERGELLGAFTYHLQRDARGPGKLPR